MKLPSVNTMKIWAPRYVDGSNHALSRTLGLSTYTNIIFDTSHDPSWDPVRLELNVSKRRYYWVSVLRTHPYFERSANVTVTLFSFLLNCMRFEENYAYIMVGMSI